MPGLDRRTSKFSSSGRLKFLCALCALCARTGFLVAYLLPKRKSDVTRSGLCVRSRSKPRFFYSLQSFMTLALPEERASCPSSAVENEQCQTDPCRKLALEFGQSYGTRPPTSFRASMGFGGSPPTWSPSITSECSAVDFRYSLRSRWN